MKVLYIGQYSNGTTSKMRADQICKILKPELFKVIDIHVPFYRTISPIRALGFRFKKGPLIKKVNDFITSQLLKTHPHSSYDLIWVDKGVYITKKTTLILRDYTSKFLHFTPDPAFKFHKSKHFVESIALYDFVVTTKSYEMNCYLKHIEEKKVILTTQGFDKEVHKRKKSAVNKSAFVFIGHYEKEREEILCHLINNKIPVKLAGINWKKFVDRNHGNKYLTYYGEGIYGKDYVQTIVDSKIAWGAISKWIPELHTTRTFEIPACGTALLTERNIETTIFFEEKEAIFYSSPEELITKVKYYLRHDDELKTISEKGYKRVHESGYDYETILRRILEQVFY